MTPRNFFILVLNELFYYNILSFIIYISSYLCILELWYGSYLVTPDIISRCEIHTIQQIECLSTTWWVRVCMCAHAICSCWSAMMDKPCVEVRPRRAGKGQGSRPASISTVAKKCLTVFTKLYLHKLDSN